MSLNKKTEATIWNSTDHNNFSCMQRNFSDFLDEQLDILFREAVARNRKKQWNETKLVADGRISEFVSCDTTVSDDILAPKQKTASPTPSERRKCHAVNRSPPKYRRLVYNNSFVYNNASQGQITSHNHSTYSGQLTDQLMLNTETEIKDNTNLNGKNPSPVKSNRTCLAEISKRGTENKCNNSLSAAEAQENHICDSRKETEKERVSSLFKSVRQSSRDLETTLINVNSPNKSSIGTTRNFETSYVIDQNLADSPVKSVRDSLHKSYPKAIKVGSSETVGKVLLSTSKSSLPDSRGRDKLLRESERKKHKEEKKHKKGKKKKEKEKTSQRDRQKQNTTKAKKITSYSNFVYEIKDYTNVSSDKELHQAYNEEFSNSKLAAKIRSDDTKLTVNSTKRRKVCDDGTTDNKARKKTLKDQFDSNPDSLINSVPLIINKSSKENFIYNIHQEIAQYSSRNSTLRDSHVDSSTSQITSMSELDELIPVLTTKPTTSLDRPIWNSVVSGFEC